MFLPSNCPTCASVEDQLPLFAPVAKRSSARSGPIERTSSAADRERYVVLCVCVCVCVCVYVCVCVGAIRSAVPNQTQCQCLGGGFIFFIHELLRAMRLVQEKEEKTHSTSCCA
jgi:hypothetical protein